jgi:hypothetical protein
MENSANKNGTPSKKAELVLDAAGINAAAKGVIERKKKPAKVVKTKAVLKTPVELKPMDLAKTADINVAAKSASSIARPRPTPPTPMPIWTTPTR